MAGVTKLYGDAPHVVTAADHVDLRVATGQVVLIMGPSGAGKTTLLAIAGALLRPTSGRVWIGQTEITSLPERRLPEIRLRRVGFIFQSANLLANLTAVENVRLVLAAAGRHDADERAHQLLDELGLSSRSRLRPDQLSGGERQRVAISRALANDAELLLADEPTANLDSRTGYQLAHTLEMLAKEHRRAIVVVTHDQRIVDIADRVLWLEDGRLTDSAPSNRDFVVDPVCGMHIDPTRAAGERSVATQTYWFCSDICLGRFDADPEHYRHARS